LCHGLDDNHLLRKILVSVVEDQLRTARNLKIMAVESKRGTRYPHEFYNWEGLNLNVFGDGPWLEFPILSCSAFRHQASPGPVRVIYAQSDNDQGRYDLIYHDPRKRKRVRRGDGTEIEVWEFTKAERWN
jgi:hypothetical protein